MSKRQASSRRRVPIVLHADRWTDRFVRNDNGQTILKPGERDRLQGPWRHRPVPALDGS